MAESPREDESNKAPYNPTSLKFCFLEQPRNTIYFGVEILLFVLFIICAVQASTIGWREYQWRFYVFGAALCILSIIGSEFNRRHKFKELAAWCYAWRYPIVTTFLVIALIDMILLRLSDVPSDCTCKWYYDWKEDCSGVDDDTSGCPPINPDSTGLRYVTRTLTILCGVLFVGCILGYWEQASYTAAHNDWIIAVLYMTVLGYIFLYFSRSLVPPKEETQRQDNWSWHQHHNENKVLSRIVVLCIVFNLFFVVMGAIVLALFGDAANATGSVGMLGEHNIQYSYMRAFAHDIYTHETKYMTHK